VIQDRLDIKAHAKINIGLRINSKRNDGFHNIESIFAPVDLCDTLTFRQSSVDSFECSDPALPGDESNLVVRARDYWRQAAMQKGWEFSPLCISLTKKIPSGAGLGGGSSDAAACLLALNKYYGPVVEKSDLYKICLILGSDVLYFLDTVWSHVSGRGELLQPVRPIFNGNVVLVWPGVHISTAHAYTSISQYLTKRSAYTKFVGFDDFIGDLKDPSEWPGNDFEKVVFDEYPELNKIKNEMLDRGAVYASMSGSGSTIYGLFDSDQSAHKAVAAFRTRYTQAFLTGMLAESRR
jgi:4-diphosphocytidyl-2-C-methyl-D-erythritol kinase